MAKTHRRLTMPQYGAARDWMRQNENLIAEGSTLTDIAGRCSAALGFAVAESTITGIIDDDLKIPRPKRIFARPSQAPTDNEAFLARVLLDCIEGRVNNSVTVDQLRSLASEPAMFAEVN